MEKSSISFACTYIIELDIRDGTQFYVISGKEKETEKKQLIQSNWCSSDKLDDF